MKLHRLAPWLVLAVVGCAGTDADVTTSGSFVVDAVPLPTIERDLWEPAHAGCEGALDEAIEFGIAERAPDLVVVLDGQGVVCVDTYSAVESELTVVDPDGIDSLWLGYMAALQEVEAFADGTYRAASAPGPGSAGNAAPDLSEHVDPASAEPQPQPSRPTSPALEGIDEAPASAEPQPQPSDPSPGAGSDTETSDEGMDVGMDTPPDSPGGPVRPDAV